MWIDMKPSEGMSIRVRAEWLLILEGDGLAHRDRCLLGDALTRGEEEQRGSELKKSTIGTRRSFNRAQSLAAFGVCLPMSECSLQRS